MFMNALLLLAGIIKRLKNAPHLPFAKLPVQFGKPQVEAYQHCTFHAVNREISEPVARRVMVQIRLRAESLVVSVANLFLRIYKIKAVVRPVPAC